MKYLITGGAGFIGSHLTKRLIAKGHEVIVVDPSVNFSDQTPGIKKYAMRISDSCILDIFNKEKPEAVFHLAGPINLRRKLSDPLFNANLDFFSGFKQILDCSARGKVRKIVYISSGGAICQGVKNIPTAEDEKMFPGSLYGMANLINEKLTEKYGAEYGLNYGIIRFSNVYGPGQWQEGVVPSFINAVLDGKTIKINGDGSQTRDFVYIDDAVDALCAIQDSSRNGIYNAGSGTEISLVQLAERIFSVMETTVLLDFDKSIQDEIIRSALDISKIGEEIGWKPKTTLREGIETTIKWYKSHGK